MSRSDAEPPAGSLAESGDDTPEDDGDLWGRARASSSPGHAINAGLPEEMPRWLYHIGKRSAALPALARRGARSGRATQVDWEKTVRRWARQGHSDARFAWERAPKGPGRLVVLWDVSGSMAQYVAWYFPWLYRLALRFKEVRIFGFGTELEELTSHLQSSYRAAVKGLYAETSLWGSGTAIGQTFEQWNQRYGDRLLGTYTTIVVISDGWDVGDPERLDAELRQMALRSRRIIWINPLMVTAGFEPRTRALKVARRYTSEMTAGATPRDLIRLGWQLGLG